MKAQTNYQDVADVLDLSYLPKTVEDIALFAEKQKYMYSVLERILQTDQGKVIVHAYDNDRDTQLIYSDFLQAMMLSTEAMMDSGELLSYLTTIKINGGSWGGILVTMHGNPRLTRARARRMYVRVPIRRMPVVVINAVRLAIII